MNSDNKTWKSVIGRQGDSNTNRNRRCLQQMGSEKRTASRNQEVKEAIHAKKTAFRAWLTNTSSEHL